MLSPGIQAALALGLGVLAPTLLDEGAHAAGVPVPAYVTPAGTAAAASLGAAILGITPVDPRGKRECNVRFLETRRALVVSHGAVGPLGNFAKLTADESADLLSRFITAAVAAVRAGADVSDKGIMGVRIDEAIADELASGSRVDYALTSLGEALYGAAVERNRALQLAPYGTAVYDPIPAQKACGLLAVEIDAQGYLESGEPLSYGLGDALGAAGTYWSEKGKAAGSWIAEKTGGLLGDVALSTPVLVVVAGYIVYRAVRT